MPLPINNLNQKKSVLSLCNKNSLKISKCLADFNIISLQLNWSLLWIIFEKQFGWEYNNIK